MPEHIAKKVLPFLFFRVVYDSINAGAFVNPFEEGERQLLIEKAVTRSVKIVLEDNSMLFMFSPSNSIAMDFVMSVLTNAGLTALYRMLLSRDYGVQALIVSSLLDEAIMFGGNFAMSMLGKTPVNGLMNTALPQKATKFSEPNGKLFPGPFRSLF